ncbi:hypothetical protein GO491_10570 [Flavobacteriaceae bacterium Ap0902]|nr:hypothetical protein [Flavobacteriaceae bacterium Ap0902]
MNCFYHPTITSVASCVDCGKGLCQDCANRYNTPICITCNHRRIKSEKQSILKELIITLIAGGVLTIFYMFSTQETSDVEYSTLQNIFTFIIVFYSGASIVAGWKTLTAITPNIFLFLPIIGWILFFMIKLFIASLIGWFMLPIRWIRKTLRWKELNKIEAIP